MINLLLVDDHSLVRDGIKAILSDYEDINIVAEAGSADEAMELLFQHDVDIALIDVFMPGKDGIETTQIVKQQFPDVHVIILSMEVNADIVSKAINFGASSFLPKDSRKEVLIDAIRTIHKGERYVNNAISDMIFNRFFETSVNGKKRIVINDYNAESISEREEEVLKLLASGCTNRETADKLFISVRTVDSHRNHIMKKLNIQNTAELVKYALRKELIKLD